MNHFKKTYKSTTKLQVLKFKPCEQIHSNRKTFMDTVFLRYFITSRALVEAGGLCSSRANIPIRKARLWYSSLSLKTVSKKAALDKVLVAIHVCLLVDTLFFLPCLRRNSSQDTFLNILNDYACPPIFCNNYRWEKE